MVARASTCGLLRAQCPGQTTNIKLLVSVTAVPVKSWLGSCAAEETAAERCWAKGPIRFVHNKVLATMYSQARARRETQEHANLTRVPMMGREVEGRVPVVVLVVGIAPLAWRWIDVLASWRVSDRRKAVVF